MCDIDYFKSYNDIYGHLMGDEVIKQVAKSIKEQLDFLRDNGCDEIQGYYYSPPLPADKIEKLFLDRGKKL